MLEMFSELQSSTYWHVFIVRRVFICSYDVLVASRDISGHKNIQAGPKTDRF